jgi:hypothetical protein
VFIDVVVVNMMKMTVVQVVSMTVVRYSNMSAAIVMGMVVVSMLFAHFFHGLPPYP